MLHFVHNKRNAYLNHTDTIFHLSNQQKFQTPDYTFCWLDCGKKKSTLLLEGVQNCAIPIKGEPH